MACPQAATAAKSPETEHRHLCVVRESEIVRFRKTKMVEPLFRCVLVVILACQKAKIALCVNLVLILVPKHRFERLAAPRDKRVRAIVDWCGGATYIASV